MQAILEQKKPFRIAYLGKELIVQEHNIGRSNVFHVVFPDATKSLTLCRAEGMDIGKHWTSIPEGRLQEAEAIGPLIAEKIKKDNL